MSNLGLPLEPGRPELTIHLNERAQVWNPQLMYQVHRKYRHRFYVRRHFIKPIILISSCVRDRDNGNQQAIRDTWGATPVIPYRFFLGDTEPISADEVGLFCPDNYFSLPAKTQESLKWALERGYTHMIRAFTDTYIDTQRLDMAQFGLLDYVGNMCYSHKFEFIHGGPGYVLSARAAQLVVDADVGTWALEDQWVGWLMIQNGIEGFHDPRFSMGRSYLHKEPFPTPANDILSVHLSSQRGQYDKYLMHRTHRRATRLR